ncbi:putative zinc-binding dehydrogenase family oxidoreductase [Xylariaceae sp. FL1272]|nr:putative zinc-binding dehydrogenase family oxidoreductase [Xylariaceae sp. FL1272]
MSAMTTIPNTQRAIIQDESGRPYLADGVAVPELLPNTFLVRTKAVALNPADYKMCKAFPTPGAIVGNDFSGTVVAVGETDEGQSPQVAVGDCVCSVVFGSNPEGPDNGAFAEYVRVPADLFLRVDGTSVDVEEAATLGTALVTCHLAFWEKDTLGLTATPDNPASEPITVLVYGGSAATGTIAIQLLRLCGLNPIATCSPHNFELVRECGASAVFDYQSPTVARDIFEHAGRRLKYAIDCISTPDSLAICYGAIQRYGGRYVSLGRIEGKLLAKRRTIHSRFVLGHEAIGEAIDLPGYFHMEPDAGKRQRARRSLDMFQGLLDRGELRPHPTQELQGGLDATLGGLDLLKSGSVSGKKLVVPLAW